MVRVLGAAQWSECWELGAQQAVIKLSGQSAGSCSVVECWELGAHQAVIKLSGQSAGSCSVVRVQHSL